MIDTFGRHITYLRVSVTDRCNLRCVYCMAEDTAFLPKDEMLSLEELERLCRAFVRKGVRKIRLTGGEPLVRRDIMTLIDGLGSLVKAGELNELALTTNGTRLAGHAGALAAAGIRRVNVSLDTLDSLRFAAITRLGILEEVLEGIMAARRAGLAVKINMVALKGVNEDEFDHMVEWCGRHGVDLCLIETMPIGDIHADRGCQYLPLSEVRRRLEARWTLTDTDYGTGGPAHYVHVAETGCRIGFITPVTHNFCRLCNRIRLTCTGTLFMCLGQEATLDLGGLLRGGANDHRIDAAIDAAVRCKPWGCDFSRDGFTSAMVARHMNVTGG